MQSVQASAMPDTMTVTRLTYAPNGLGGRVESAAVLGPYPCRIAPLRGGEVLEADGARAVAEGWVKLSYGHDLEIFETDEVTVNDVPYSVVSVEEARIWKTCGRAVIRRKE